MAFTVAFVAHAPDADPAQHRSVIETRKYKLFTVLVSGQAQAVEECRKLARDLGVHSIVLCPGFTHRDIAEIAASVGAGVGVTVARGDGPSSRVTMEVMRREGWFS